MCLLWVSFGEGRTVWELDLAIAAVHTLSRTTLLSHEAATVAAPLYTLGEIWCFSPLIFRGHFQEIGIAALRLLLKPRHVEKFQKCRLTDVRERDLRKRTEASKFTKMGTCRG